MHEGKKDSITSDTGTSEPDFGIGSIDEPVYEDEEGLSYRNISDNYEVDGEGRDSAAANHHFGIVNSYFREVGTEPLLTHDEEVEIASKIECLGLRSRRIFEAIEAIIGRRLGKNRDKTTIEMCKLIDAEKINYGDEFPDKRLRRLVRLLEANHAKATELRNRFIKSNLRLVASIAKKYVGRGIPFLDLLQEGNLGLIRAVEKFDYKRGFRFSTYASWWITQSILRASFSQTKPVRVPAYVLEKASKVRKIRNRLMKDTGGMPHDKELADKVMIHNVLSLDSSPEGQNLSLIDVFADSKSAPVDSLIAAASLPKRLDQALAELDSREREVLKMRFGIGYENAFTLDEVGKRFSVTKERIRQIEKSALEKIKNSSSGTILKSMIEVCQ